LSVSIDGFTSNRPGGNMLKLSKTLFAGAAISAFALGMGLETANATEGYFANGIGARHKALAGAGAADSRDVTATTNNPAGLVHAPDEAAISASLFSPDRGFTGSGGNPAFNFVPNGEVDSKSNYFVIPNFAISKGLHGNPLFDVIGFSVSGNGGMNTDYKNLDHDLGPDGVFRAGKSGVNLEQMLIQFTGAKRITDTISIGVGPIIARQIIHVKGLNSFAPYSSNHQLGNNPPTTSTGVSNTGTAESWGFGARLGLEAALMPNVRLGITGTTPMIMSEFSEYSGLFAEQGGFDIPPSLQIGLAVDVMPNLTIMADYKRIWYSYTASINNPSTNIFNCDPTVFPPAGSGCLGNNNGTGFGWEDINVYKVAAELRDAMPGLTLRAGYAYSENPVQSRDVMFNILAPGIVKHHISGGAMLKISDNLDLELSGLYVPEEKLRGLELDLQGVNPAHAIELRMSQWEVTAGLVYHFGQEEEALK